MPQYKCLFSFWQTSIKHAAVSGPPGLKQESRINYTGYRQQWMTIIAKHTFVHYSYTAGAKLILNANKIWAHYYVESIRNLRGAF